MNVEGLLNRAIIFAVKAHEGQKRKGSETPYILHPLEAAAIVATMTSDETLLAAAVLHDVVEDTPVTQTEIAAEFGKQVAELVANESENKREELPAEATWKVRKQETIEHLKTATRGVKMITLGDKLSNIRAIHRDRLLLGDALWQRFNQKDKREHEWYYRAIADCLSELSEYEAYREYITLINATFGE